MNYQAREIDLNILNNGNFEIISATDADVPEGYESFYSTTGATPIFSMEQNLDVGTTYEVRPIEGTRMFKINSEGSTIYSSGLRTQFNVPITAGSTYDMRCWLKSYSSSGYIMGQIDWYTNEGTLISSDEGDKIYSYSDWTRSEISTTSPSTASHAKIKVITGTSIGRFWVDQLFFSLHTKNYVTPAEFAAITESEVGTGKEISRSAFTTSVTKASLIAERDSGRRWVSTDAGYSLIQSAVAHLTMSLIKSGHYGDTPEPALKMEGATTDWNKAQYEYYIKKALRARGKMLSSRLEATGNPYW